MNYAVIMAGGSGKRLWPLSRQRRPKQVLKLLSGDTLLRKCYQRLEGIFDSKNIIVLTNANFVDTVRDDLPELPKENIIAEPAMRDTASAIGLAATILLKKDPDANMVVVTADQLLEPVEKFENAMQTALSFLDESPEALLTFGIQPTFASTQFGYIKFSEESLQNGIHKIDSFREKPDADTAAKYLKDSSYAWNSGLFAWKCETIMENLRQFVPSCIEPLGKIKDAWGTADQENILNEWFLKLEKISIDYAVMENSDKVYGIALKCQWHDLGAFRSLQDIIEADANGNTVISKHIETLGSNGNIVVTEDDGHLFALIGVDNMIVAHTPDATLVCPIDQADRLKELLEQIQANKKDMFL